jgi:type VI secretion system FHA domain protein
MPTPKYVTLEVVGPKASGLGTGAMHTFDMKGGRFGRAPDNDWVINDRYVSRHQAQIGYQSGRFFIAVDPEASAQMFINGPQTRICAPQKYPLTAGDQIIIDELLIRVDLSADRPSTQEASENEEKEKEQRRRNPFGDQPVAQTDSEPADDLLASHSISGENLPPAPEPPDEGSADQRRQAYSPSNDAIWLPPAPQPVNIPDDWYKDDPGKISSSSGQPQSTGRAAQRTDQASQPGSTGESRPNPGGVSRTGAGAVRRPGPVVAPAAVGGGDDLHAFLEGAGIEASSITPEMLGSLGTIVRTVVQGVVDILRARAEIRREFRMNVTLAQAEENNPLKFSANAEDALYNILVKRNAAFLAAVPAFEEAFDDLRGHQLAMLKGMRAGYQNMLERFDPRTLERRFESPEKGAGLKGLMGGSKMWDHYRSWFAQMTEDEEDGFRRLFGDKFAEAYEQEMQRLAGVRRKRRCES